MDSLVTGFTNLTSRLNPFKQPEAPIPPPAAGRRRSKTRKVKRRRSGKKSNRL